MKIKILAIIHFLIGWQIVFAGVEIPTDYTLGCYDGSFAQNELQVQSDGNQITFVSSSHSHNTYRGLFKSLSNNGWGPFEVLFSLPAENCELSENDNKIVTCRAKQLIVEGRGLVSQEKEEMKYINVQIRRVDELPHGGRHTTGYELILIKEATRIPILAQVFEQNAVYKCLVK